MDATGQPSVTIPRCGTLEEAGLFAANHCALFRAELEKRQARREMGGDWRDGSEVLFQGEHVPVGLFMGLRASMQANERAERN